MAGTYSFDLISDSELGTITKDSFPLQIVINISRNESLEVCALLNLDAYDEPYFDNPYSYAFATFPEIAGETTLLVTYDMVKDSLLEGDNFICLAMGYNPETVRTLITFTYTKSKDLFIGAPYKKISLTNLCPAINGINGFNIKSNSGTATGESSTTHIKYSEQSLKLNINDTSTSEVYAISTTTLPLNSEHIYYARIEAYQETKFGAAELYFPIAEPQMFNLATGDVGKWNMYSVVKERSSFTAGNYTFRLDFNRERSTETTGSIWYDGWMIVDLTEAFGAGNEPEAVWCDENIPYAVGDFSIELPSDGTARKVKEIFIGRDGVAKRVKEAFIGINGIARKVFESIKLQSIYIVENTWPLAYEALTLEEVEQNFPYEYFKINAIYSDGSEKEITNLTVPDVISSDEVVFSYAEGEITVTVTADIDISLPPS